MSTDASAPKCEPVDAIAYLRQAEAILGTLDHSAAVDAEDDLGEHVCLQVANLCRKYAACLDEIAAWKKAIEGLTPSGSEFVDDPEACAAHIRDRYNPMHTFKQLRQERDALRAALKDLLACYDYQTESKYCICGSNDLGGHSMACKVQMRAQDAAHAALEQPAAQSKEGM